ncbi:MAG: sugar kinase [Clostridia bacterium]|nr:sugar kinase [Clostridia bacterium]
MAVAVTLGEALLRLSAPEGVALEDCHRLEVRAAGAESNVAVALARFGVASAWISALVDNPLGRLVAGSIRRHGVDLSGVVWSADGRVGTYYIELGRPPRPNRIVYDRADSAFARLDPDAVNWDLLDGARVLHLSGVTMAVNPAVALRARDEAARRGVPVSWDVNYRARLWTESEARKALAPAVAGCAVLKLTAEEAHHVFGFEGSAEVLAASVAESTGAAVVVVTDGSRGAVAAVGGRLLREEGHEVEGLDRVGAGDAFVAGLLYALLDSPRPGLDTSPDAVRRGLRLGSAHAALKHTYFGDIAWTTLDDVRRLAGELQGTTWR